MKLRLQITKEPEIRFISHLEYMRTLARAIRRAKLPAAYSEGFNPHLKFSLASALGVGVASFAEFLEIEMAEPVEPEAAARALAQALPRGIRVLAADAVENQRASLMSQAAGAEYRVTLPLIAPEKFSEEKAAEISEESAAGKLEGNAVENPDEDFSAQVFARRRSAIESAVREYNAAPEVLYKKIAPKTKSGCKEIDAKFFVPHLDVAFEKERVIFHFACKITPTGSMKALDVLRALAESFALELPLELADVERLALFRVDRKGRKRGMLGN